MVCAARWPAVVCVGCGAVMVLGVIVFGICVRVQGRGETRHLDERRNEAQRDHAPHDESV
jgi:hypothetical protein